MRLAQPDWLQHRIEVSGPKAELEAFRQAAGGPGTVPWRHDVDRLAEDWFHLLMTQARREITAQGAHLLATQLRDAMWESHERLLAGIAVSRSPFDLHALLPVPPHLLRRGPDDAQSLAWLWQNWGTTWPLRRIRRLSAEADGRSSFGCTFWSADWTPWPAIAALRARYPTLSIRVTPVYIV